MKQKYFEHEINLIKDDDLKADARFLVNTIPDYFFTIPASSSGKYHPAISLGKGGLLRHTQAVVKMAYELGQVKTVGVLNEREKDLIVIAAIMHDTFKSGFPQQEHTIHEHPLRAAENLEKHAEQLSMNTDELATVAQGIRSHMGQWNTNYYNKESEVLPTPQNDFDRILHTADYLASRKYITIDC